MSDEPTNSVLERLRAIRATQAEHSEQLREVRDRFTRVELGLAGVRKDIANLTEVDTLASIKMDKFGDRLARVGRRLEIDEAFD